MGQHKITRFVDSIYDLVNDEEDARICRDIKEEACKEAPGNYFLILVSNTLTKIGDELSNPKTVLSWIMNALNAPVALISFIVPIRESGSMIPQLVIAHYIRRISVRKWIWVVGSFIQFASISGMGFVALYYSDKRAGWLILSLLVLFSLARGLCSVASKDVLGKTVPKTRRGKLKGYTASISGIFVLLAGLYLFFKSEDNSSITFYGSILLVAGSTWLLAALVYSAVREFKGETEGGKSGFSEAVGKIKLLATDVPFRKFVISRSLLLCSALSAPFYIILSQQNIGKETYLLGLFILASGISAIISAPFWGRMADKSSKNVMVKSALITSLLGILMFVIVTWAAVLREEVWLYPAAFFVLGIAHNGVRLGRKTYIVDMAGGNKRTDYVAVSNTVIGVILLMAGGISALASVISVEGTILVLSLFGFAGAYMSAQLPNVE